MKALKPDISLKTILTTIVLASSVMLTTNTFVVASTFKADATKTEYLNQPISVNGGSSYITMKLRAIPLRDLLKMLSGKAGFNLLLDESVTGDISVDLENVSINQALDALKDYSNLVYMQDGKTLVVGNKDSELAKNLSQQVSQMIPVKYVNAKLAANILNNTVFSSASPKATAEYRTNSVVIVGDDNDVRLAEDLLATIDVARESKTFKINNANVLELAQLLQASIFNDGVCPFNSENSSGTSGINAKSTPLGVTTETFQEGTGASQVQSSSGSSSNSQQQTYQLRSKKISSKDIKISPEGPIIVPDTRSNMLTILGTSDQIALAESIIPTLDKKLPQVAIETSLVEISENNLRELSSIWGHSSGQWATGFNDKAGTLSAGDPGVLGLIGLPTLSNDKINAVGNSLAFSTTPITKSLDFLYQLNMMISAEKAKLLANPTILAVHNSEAIISITEEIVRSTTITRDATGFTQYQTEIGEAGIVLNILPKISGDGYVTLRIRPSISTIKGQVIVSGTTVTLLKKKDFAVQEARVLDGQTLALGGLLEEVSQKDTSKIPWLGEMPLIGALFRASQRNQTRTELIMLVTPKIAEDHVPVSAANFSEKPIVNIPQSKLIIKNTSDTQSQNNSTTEVTNSSAYQKVTPTIINDSSRKTGSGEYNKRQVDELLKKYLPKTN